MSCIDNLGNVGCLWSYSWDIASVISWDASNELYKRFTIQTVPVAARSAAVHWRPTVALLLDKYIYKRTDSKLLPMSNKFTRQAACWWSCWGDASIIISELDNDNLIACSNSLRWWDFTSELKYNTPRP